MPVLLHRYSSRLSPSSAIHIGLINNMADEALKATERQYISLLDEASDGREIRLSFFTLPGVARGSSAGTMYSDIEDLWSGHLDGLIVTGREPLAADLREEPYWDSFTRTLAWARENSLATVWSCLAAHAAVFHMDGICRRKREDKLFGIFACDQMADHALMGETAAKFELPHSRWNSLDADELAETGYTVLTQTADGEVDTFIKQQQRLFVFFQGHPEYGADTLLREYRRDITRYFRGETAKYPSMPKSYFDPRTAEALLKFQLQNASGPDQAWLPAILALLDSITMESTWRPNSARLYRNWLRQINLQREVASRATSKRPLVHAAAAHRAAQALDAMAKA